MSDIPANIVVSLTATRGKKALHTIQKLKPAERSPGLAAVLKAIDNATNKGTMANAKAMAGLLSDEDEIAAAVKAYNTKAAALKSGAAPAAAPAAAEAVRTMAQFIEDIDAAETAEDAEHVLTEARTALSSEEFTEVEHAHKVAWTA
jgi:hypothetical protein